MDSPSRSGKLRVDLVASSCNIESAFAASEDDEKPACK
ncbi:hypothetical protein A2U01_0056991, partial [Trifolium medium]|nr:hypothetical protein [Trifolium medium]